MTGRVWITILRKVKNLNKSSLNEEFHTTLYISGVVSWIIEKGGGGHMHLLFIKNMSRGLIGLELLVKYELIVHMK